MGFGTEKSNGALKKALAAGFIGISIPIFIAILFTPNPTDKIITLVSGVFCLAVGIILIR